MKKLLLLLCLSATLRAEVTAGRSALEEKQACALARACADSIKGEVIRVAKTGSMKPMMDEHAVLVLEKVDFKELNVGDVVVYYAGTEGLIVHRLYERHKDYFFALGDNNGKVDDLCVNEKNFRGRVCAVFYTR